jgi:hypothetical protein
MRSTLMVSGIMWTLFRVGDGCLLVGFVWQPCLRADL